MAKKVSTTLPAFTGGLNDTASASDIRDNEAQTCQNVRLSEVGAVESRNGYTTYGNDAGNYKTLGLYEFRPTSGANKQIAVWNTDAYVYDTGTWTAQSRTLTAGATAHFNTFTNLALMVNGNEFEKYDGSSWGAVGGTPPSAPLFIESWQNRVFVWEADNTIFWSEAGDAEDWTVATDNLDVPSKDDGDAPTGLMADGQERLVCFKERSIHALYSVQAGSANRRTISPSIGAVSQRSIVQVPNGIIFLSRGEKSPAVYFLSGNRLVDLSSSKIKTGLAGLSHAQLTQACAVYYDHYYILSVPSSGTAYNDTNYILDLSLSTSENPVWLKDTGYSPSVWALFEGSSEMIPYFGEGQADARVYRYDSGTSDNPSGVKTAIDQRYKTKYFDFGYPIQTKRTREMEMVLEAQAATAKVDFYHDVDFSGTGTITKLETKGGGALWGTMIWGTGKWGGGDAVRGSVDINGRGRYHAFEWRLNTVDKVFKLYPNPAVTMHLRKLK